MKISKPIRRSPIRYKAKRHRELWRSGRVILDGPEMMVLRCQVYERARGFCENCGIPVKFDWFHMHHIVHRSNGGSDTMENVTCLCLKCHCAEHPGVQWSKKEIA